MWYEWFVLLKNESIELILTTKQMITNILFMLLNSLWIVISYQEKNWVENAKKLAEKDRNNIDHHMPNQFIQGAALTAETCPPSSIIRSALRWQFWKHCWKTQRERIHISRILSSSIAKPGQTIPYTAKIIPVFTENVNLVNNHQMNIYEINLRSLMKQGRYLVVNFEAHPSDGWKFYGPEYSDIPNHCNIEDRIQAVKTLIELTNINRKSYVSVYCDTIDDHTNHLFRGSPERLYILYDQKIFYQGGNGPFGYSIPSLEFFLKNNLLN